MNEITKVFLVGAEEWRDGARQALAGACKSSVTGIGSLWELCALPEAVLVDVAVIHPSFQTRDLCYAAEYIRRRWPDAVILVIGTLAVHLEDPLYDHRVSNSVSFDQLAEIIEMSAIAKQRVKRFLRSRPIYARSHAI